MHLQQTHFENIVAKGIAQKDISSLTHIQRSLQQTFGNIVANEEIAQYIYYLRGISIFDEELAAASES